MIAETLALNGAEEFACNTCSNYEYLTYVEACSYAFLHSNRFEQAMAQNPRIGGTSRGELMLTSGSKQLMKR